jgi:beta-glucosidase-like glycosyl hydrolase
MANVQAIRDVRDWYLQLYRDEKIDESICDMVEAAFNAGTQHVLMYFDSPEMLEKLAVEAGTIKSPETAPETDA